MGRRLCGMPGAAAVKPTRTQLAAGERAAMLAKEAPPRTSFTKDVPRFVLAIATAVLADVPEPRKPRSKKHG
jgi:hypothetical protein